jgi:hypothetical protein
LLGEWLWTNLWFVLATLGAFILTTVAGALGGPKSVAACVMGCVALAVGGPAETWLGLALIAFSLARGMELAKESPAWRTSLFKGLRETCLAMVVGLAGAAAIDLIVVQRWTAPEDPRDEWWQEYHETDNFSEQIELRGRISNYTPPQPPPEHELRDWETGLLKVLVTAGMILKFSGWWLWGALLLAVLITAYAPAFGKDYLAVSRFLDIQKLTKAPALAAATFSAFTLFAQAESVTYQNRFQLQLREGLLMSWVEVDEWAKKTLALARVEEEIQGLSEPAKANLSEEFRVYAINNQRAERLGWKLGTRAPLAVRAEETPPAEKKPPAVIQPADVEKAKAEAMAASRVYGQSREAVIKVLQGMKIPVGHPLLQSVVDSLSSSTVKSSFERLEVKALSSMEAARVRWKEIRASQPEQARPAAALEKQIAEVKSTGPAAAAAPVVMPRPRLPVYQRFYGRATNLKAPGMRVRWMPEFSILKSIPKACGKRR